MRRSYARVLAIFVMTLLAVSSVLATCGGGGGGGTGGMSGLSGAGEMEVYPVPWRIANAEDTPAAGSLVVYWFPSSQVEFDKSSLRNSRMLSLYASQCVTMDVADGRSPIGQKLAPDEKLPVVVLAQADGKVLGTARNKEGFLRVAQVEKLVQDEMKLREAEVKQAVADAKESVKKGDKDAAIARYRDVLARKCLFPKQAKNAEKELKKLGVTVEGAGSGLAPVYDLAKSAEIERTLRRGLAAENDAKYTAAEQLYEAASRLDPADPVPLRYLGELYRHHIGDWTKARETFEELLRMPADPLSRAVALHGLGKMTIHEGAFKKGLGLMEDAVREFPLALAYRNLAVYWNSEGDVAKADVYVKQALALDPNDPYNLVFSAVFLAQAGHTDEALQIAREHAALLSASYNLAAIYAQAGQKEKALDLLKRHFFEYERYQSVRSKEMMEARVDAVFASLAADAGFKSLTSGADGRLPMPMRR